jgi:hypothetical protein
MADKNRYFNTGFWSDEYILDLKSPLKLAFAYFFTNDVVNWCGIYKIALKKITGETGHQKDALMPMLVKFEQDGKIKYFNGWIGMKNFIKRNKYHGNNMKAFVNDFNEIIKLGVPDELLVWVMQNNKQFIDLIQKAKALKVPQDLRKPLKGFEDFPYSYSYFNSYSHSYSNSDFTREPGSSGEAALTANDSAAEYIPTITEIWSPEYRGVRGGDICDIFQRLFDTFYFRFSDVYPGEQLMIRKEIYLGVMKTLAHNIQEQYKDFQNQLAVTYNKIILLMMVAQNKNKYQPWRFNPVELSKHWDDLVDGCVKDDPKNIHIDHQAEQAAMDEKVKRLKEKGHGNHDVVQ